MADLIINSDSERTLYSDKIIAEVEDHAFIAGLIGGENDLNSFVTRPGKTRQNGKLWRIPLRSAVTSDAIEDDGTLEGNEVAPVISTTDIVANMRSKPFGGQHRFEEIKTLLPLREELYADASQWATMDLDKAAFDKMVLASGSLPTKANRGASKYNVEFSGDATSWSGLDTSHYITAKGISRAKTYFRQRGLRPGRIGGGKSAFIMVIPTEAAFHLRNEDKLFQAALKDALPRSADHVFFKGNGWNPWGAWDGVILVEDMRAVYGGTNTSFLEMETEDPFKRVECLFLGAQALGYAEWEKPNWTERLWDYNKRFGVAVSRTIGFEKPVLNRGTLASPSNREYGMGYYLATVPYLG